MLLHQTELFDPEYGAIVKYCTSFESTSVDRILAE